MRKGDQTRRRILDRAARLFNTKGYASASLSDIMQATGLEKGGIYNHFGNKEQLAVESFDYAMKLAAAALGESLAAEPTALLKLKKMNAHFIRVFDNPPIEGGCPLANCAIESDDANPLLAQRASAAFASWHSNVSAIVRQGQITGEFRQDIDAESIATLLISALEGALMLSKIQRTKQPLEQAAAVLDHLIDSLRSDNP